ncbi:MAG: hypothetical protein B7Y05_02895 [Polynucleobacter sp. 24-46-87]|nr:MAG: hypothetical protein B7Y05_02895 [Polynucleobacter sp. 24-46-87]
METIGQRIRRLRKAQDISQRELGDRLAWGNTRLSMYERDERTPKIRQLDELSKALGCTVAELINDEKSNVESVTRPLRNRVRLLAWDEITQYIDDPENDSHSQEWVETDLQVPKSGFALRVVGDSMAPTFPDGCVVIADPVKPAVHGSYVIARLGQREEATFKQYVKDGSASYLKPVNPLYPMIPFIPAEGSQILGVVVEMIHRISFL